MMHDARLPLAGCLPQAAEAARGLFMSNRQTVLVALIPAEKELPLTLSVCQIAFARFYESVCGDGLRIQPVEHSGSPASLTGEFHIRTGRIASAAVGHAALAWLLGSTGRKVCLSADDAVVVADNAFALQELVRVMSTVKARIVYKRRNVWGALMVRNGLKQGY